MKKNIIPRVKVPKKKRENKLQRIITLAGKGREEDVFFLKKICGNIPYCREEGWILLEYDVVEKIKSEYDVNYESQNE